MISPIPDLCCCYGGNFGASPLVGQFLQEEAHEMVCLEEVGDSMSQR